jgi:uncharacterized protein (DUF736 family)
MTSSSPSLLQRISARVLRWAAEQRRREEDEQYWQAALHDPRLMADIHCAIARAEGASVARTIVVPPRPQLSWLVAASHALGH